VSRFRLWLELEVEVELSDSWQLFGSGHGFYDFVYQLRGRRSFVPGVVDQYEDELELDETYVFGRLGRGFYLSLGRQVVAWGASETIRVTDVLNPLDLREPGLTDIENLRLPVTMTKLDYVTGNWTFSGLALHEIRLNKNPVLGHDFYPYAFPLPDSVKPESNWGNTEVAVSVRGTFEGWDLSLYWADLYSDEPHTEIVDPRRIALRHSRLKMVGAAWDLAAGDWLFKVEGAHFRGLEFSSTPDDSYSKTDAMVGCEFAGWNDTSMTFEAALRHLHGFDPSLNQSPDLQKRDRVEWVFRFTRLLFHQTLALNLVAVVFEPDGDGGAVERLEARYDVSDQLEIATGVVLFQSGNRPGFEALGENDRFFFEVNYRF
jgi:hypothetical protein